MYIPCDEAFPFVHKLSSQTRVTLTMTFDLHILKLENERKTPISQIKQLMVQDHNDCTPINYTPKVGDHNIL